MKQTNSTRIETIVKLISLPIIGVLSTLLVQQLFFKTNKKEEEKIKIQSEILKREYETFNKIERFSKLGQTIISFKFFSVHVDQNSRVIGQDKVGENVNLPEIIIDPVKRESWSDLYITIYENRDNLPLELFEAVDEVHQFFVENPYPKELSFTSVEKTIWGSRETLGRWLTLNDKLELRLARYRNLE